MSKTRQYITPQLAEQILLKSKRRCCLCFADGNDKLREGSITHIEPSTKGTTEDNLVFLCVEHNAELYRGEIDIDELKKAKIRLYQETVLPSDFVDVRANKPWHKFEEHVRSLLIAELKKSVKDTVSIYSNRIYPGRSGLAREIDISAELLLAGFKLLIAVDVKYTKRKISIQELEQFASKLQDIGANKGIFVSNTDFSESAMRYAKTHGIALLQLDEESKEIKDGLLAESFI